MDNVQYMNTIGKMSQAASYQGEIFKPLKRRYSSRLLIKFELGLQVGINSQFGLSFLTEEAVAEHERIHFGPHEAPVGILRCADDWLPAHIK